MNIRIFNKFRLLLLFVAALGLGCSKEQAPDDTQSGNPVEVFLNVNASAAAAALNNETDVNRLRVVVFSSIGTSDAGRLILNKYYSTAPTDKRFKEIITSGKRDILLIVNEPLTGDGRELDSYRNIATMSDVRNLSLIYGGAGSVGVYTPAEIPMFISHINKQVLVNGANEVSGEVERVMAKVTIKLNVKNSNFPVDKHVVIDNITIKNLPQSSSLIAKLYSADVLVSSEKQNAGFTAPISGYDFSSVNTFYVPEYILSNTDKGAYIEIVGHINGEPTRVTKWTVKLGDAMDDAKAYGDRYNITRNRHYTFIGDVKTYNELAVKITVLPWNAVNLNEDVGHYVAFDRVTNYADVVIADGSNLNEMGETIKVICNTNTGGWYAVVKDAKGKVVRTTPTAAVTVATTQTLNVVIPKLNDEPYSQSYTIGIYHKIVADEQVGPVKSLSFTQYKDSGFIPNSVLTAAGWPADKLPATGLQLAMRGDGILPGGTPAAEDPLKQWKTAYTTTPGVESGTSVASARLGMGKSSTDAMIADDVKTGAKNHPAAQYCRSMGPEWYLPSIAELDLIYKNKSLLGASYSFSAVSYWSATENGSTYSWVVTFSIGYTDVDTKTVTSRVRCVRGI